MSKYRSDELQRLARIFKALSHPHRLHIFLRLTPRLLAGDTCSVNGEPCSCVGELGQDLGIVPSTVSHHIKELCEAGLIQMERHGQRIECSIEPRVLRELETFFVRSNGD